MKRISTSFVVLSLLCLGSFTQSVRGDSAKVTDVTFNSVRDRSSVETVDFDSGEGHEVLHVSKAPLLVVGDFAKADVVPKGGHAVLELTLRDKAASRLMAFSKKNVGQKLAVLVNHQLVKAPLIRIPITERGCKWMRLMKLRRMISLVRLMI